MALITTYKRYIEKLDVAIFSDSNIDTKELQNEILAVFRSELDGLKRGSTNYRLSSFITNLPTDETKNAGGSVDI